MTRFEDRHRELREAADANADDHRGWDQWTTPSESKLSAFRDATEELVDDLVAAVRRWDDHLPGCQMWRHEVEHLGQLLICSGKDKLLVDEECTCGYDEFMAKLAALDEASGRG